MKAKVSIWFGNYFQNGNGFHFVRIQFPIDLETFFGLVSKSNGNSFHFGNVSKSNGNGLLLWILLVGIQNRLVTIGNMLWRMTVKTYGQMRNLPITDASLATWLLDLAKLESV